MATSFQNWAKAYAATPAVVARLDWVERQARAREEERRAAVDAFRKAHWEKHLADTAEERSQYAAEIALAKLHNSQKDERRKGDSPSAAGAAREIVEDSELRPQDTESRCALCDSANITIGAISTRDEYGVEDSEEGGWCWDCERFVELVEVAIPATDVMDAESEGWWERVFAEEVAA